jgi:hypothetical protein
MAQSGNLLKPKPIRNSSTLSVNSALSLNLNKLRNPFTNSREDSPKIYQNDTSIVEEENLIIDFEDFKKELKVVQDDLEAESEIKEIFRNTDPRPYLSSNLLSLNYLERHSVSPVRCKNPFMKNFNNNNESIQLKQRTQS